MTHRIIQHFSVQVGITTGGFREIESMVLPEYNHGMVFIVGKDDCHYAFSLRVVDGVVVTPVYEITAADNH
ncbi:MULTISPECIES: hypothetical protein [Klebsiella pneumoniae complex]|uniref:hypothetical protein n=1 Tax=Klebsiella pneumoniae complex TaxID=3390273 RepID=UPI0013CFB38F|nr:MULTISPECIES: hypothetical protein [Klebsiella]HCB0298282.1 hypothetical protein [Klebsiella pneumoniae]HCQ8124596.1 hypothetical protein [Klebsiella quasipneumoniae subsp. similipneumoniae]MCS5748439.1 hypothetical protein [Klebsiella quasipneumoniae subsp. quasipneumoniae]UVW54647.1 hypothetical protein NYO12_09970 [Klebsiella variicola]HBX9997324.1 hypothetical protein [Klebsiella variicola]